MSRNEDVAIIKAARELKLDPANMTDKDYRNAQLLAQKGVRAKASAVKSALGSRMRTEVFHLTVLPEVSDANEEECKACDLFKHTQDGEPVCTGCGCSGKYLRSKWKDPKGKCTPLFKWDNNGKPTMNSPDLSPNPPGGAKQTPLTDEGYGERA